jgi:GNAT superfamily N-acetyltransferase
MEELIMVITNYKKDNFLITTDRAKTDIEAVCAMLSRSYWANTRPREVIEKSIENSLCFNLFDDLKQIGFARVITDYSTLAYICDVFIDENYRGCGLGKWLVECILEYPDFKNIRRTELSTKDAHELYRKYGFTELPHPENVMHILRNV